ncbi:carboxypeptidase-like regulatory domain-containing protein [Gemmatimonas sp.]|uniref:carboxypeptidase-like regulatory domain-containing protein n=1 Tax=Gemmatimonas sp. TaxID=1962908 RepID=UPI00286EB345|nr:carboxypeptidase-like regulatory domain-containing protein [Gemmatimonas sp.]
MTIRWRSTLRVGLIIGAVYGRLLAAQGPRESIVVRVQNDSARALAGVAVIVVRGPDRASQQVITGSAGVASVEFADGTGDYLVSAKAAGYAAVRRRITAAEGEHRFRITLLLKPDTTRLVAIRVRAARDAPPPFHRSSFDQQPGDVPGVVGGVTGFVTPELAGSIDALALTVPGTVAGSTGLSVNGLSADQNAVRLNGGEFSSGSLPRAARVETRVQTSTFDATRGGFAGAAVDLHLGPGSRTYQRRSAFGTLSGTPFLASAKANSRPVGLSTLSSE